MSVLTRAFVAAMFYKMKKENFLQRSDRWAYMQSDRKVYKHLKVQLALISCGVDPHLTLSEDTDSDEASGILGCTQS
ncbi:hypothetical protein AMECASPLE_016244 [Ameca splendens]|uniref:Uncharacterized protein n=1 Tax=Ameca splendens TaxID=208324 RepID=A0ABV0ZCP4_9TELE